MLLPLTSTAPSWTFSPVRAATGLATARAKSGVRPRLVGVRVRLGVAVAVGVRERVDVLVNVGVFVTVGVRDGVGVLVAVFVREGM